MERNGLLNVHSYMTGMRTPFIIVRIKSIMISVNIHINEIPGTSILSSPHYKMARFSKGCLLSFVCLVFISLKVSSDGRFKE